MVGMRNQNRVKLPIDGDECSRIIRITDAYCGKMIAHLPHDLTIDDIFKEFYEPEHIEVCKLGGMLTINQQNYETWSFDAQIDGRRITIVTQDKNFLRPDYVVMKEHHMTAYLQGRLSDWLQNANDIEAKRIAFRDAIDTLRRECKTLTQVLFHWPTLASLGVDPQCPFGKRIAKASKSSPSERPAIAPNVKQALRDMTTLLHAARLMPDETPKLPITVSFR